MRLALPSHSSDPKPVEKTWSKLEQLLSPATARNKEARTGPLEFGAQTGTDKVIAWFHQSLVTFHLK
jgi:transposase